MLHNPALGIVIIFNNYNNFNNFVFQIIKSSKMVKNLYEKPVRFKDQKFEKLYKHHHDVLNILYSDPIFPPTPSSIGSTDVENVKWSRPNVSAIF
jgi:hypothetical protein